MNNKINDSSFERFVELVIQDDAMLARTYYLKFQVDYMSIQRITSSADNTVVEKSSIDLTYHSYVVESENLQQHCYLFLYFHSWLHEHQLYALRHFKRDQSSVFLRIVITVNRKLQVVWKFVCYWICVHFSNSNLH